MGTSGSFSLDAITGNSIAATDDWQAWTEQPSHDGISDVTGLETNESDPQSPHKPSSASLTSMANLDSTVSSSNSHDHDLSPTSAGPDSSWQSLPVFSPSYSQNIVLINGVGNTVLGQAGGAGGNFGGTTTGSSSTAVTGSASTGLIINVSYDSSVSSAPASFTNDVAQVVQYFESHFTDPITININVGYGEVGGTQMSGSALGQSETYLSSLSYSQLKGAMAADAKTSADNSTVASLPSADPTGGTYWVSTAEAKALGLSTGSTSVDGYVGFSSSSSIFDYNNTDGVGAGQYDFVGVVAHEISEVMGRMLLVGATIGTTHNSYDPLDLMHFSASGVHDFSGSTPGYFSVDNGATSLNAFNTVSGGDAGDWAGATIDAFNAFGATGVVAPISSADLTVLDAIGWDAAGASSPPPAQPDLTATNLAFNVTYAGVSVGFQVNDIGTVDTTVGSTAGVYLSKDSTITTSDTLIGSYSTPALGAGTSDSETTSLGLPTNLTPGTYYIGAYADFGFAIAEGNEANNASNAVRVVLGNNTGNSLNGASGGDTILGLGGNDTLYGGGGADVLMGGAGNDHFVYKATTDGMDSIVDFMSGTDVLDFSRSAFGSRLAVKNANTGTLDPSHFIASDTGPSTLAQKFWYDTTNHTLYYDSDGSGAGAAIAMAHFDPSVTLHNTDIHLI